MISWWFPLLLQLPPLLLPSTIRTVIFILPAGFIKLHFPALSLFSLLHVATRLVSLFMCFLLKHACSHPQLSSGGWFSLGWPCLTLHTTPPYSGPHWTPFSRPADAFQMNVICPKLFILTAWVSGGWAKELVGPEIIFLPTLYALTLCYSLSLFVKSSPGSDKSDKMYNMECMWKNVLI